MHVFLLLLFAGAASASSLDFGTLYYSRQPDLFRLLTKYRLWPPVNTWNPGQLQEPSQEAAIPEPFIIGGDSSSIYDFPYQLSLRNGGVHICGASVIAERWALTAAHCLDDGSLPTWITFRGGSPHRLSGGAIFHAEDYHLHDQFNRQTLDYDVAVVLIQESFYVDPIEPVRLADSSMTFPVPANAVVTGWGTAEDGFVPLILQNLEVYTQTMSVCMTAWIDQISDRMLCAGGGSVGKDVCNGDSGGPLLVNGYQIGLVSWGSDTCAINLPGIYTSLLNDEVRSFIKMVTGV